MSDRHVIVELDFSEASLPEEIPMKGGAANSWLAIPKTFPEGELFALFMTHLGPPNGAMSWAVSHLGGDPDAPWKWEYIFKIPSGEAFSVQRSWLGVEVFVWGGAVSAADFTAFLGKNLKKYKTDIANSLDSLEQYVLMVNPEVRHRNLAKFAYDELQKVEVDGIFFPDKLTCTERLQKKCLDSIKKYPRNAHQEVFYAVSLVTESAFWAESHLNMMIALLRRDDFAENEKLFDDYLRTPWQKKVEQMPFFCRSVKAPDLTAEPLVNARMLFDLRNRIAHSYPDKDTHGVSKMWFLERIPILPNSGPYPQFQFGLDCILPSRRDANEVYERAKALVNYLTSLVDEDLRGMIEMFSEANPIGWNETKGMFSIPFGNQVVVGFPMAREQKPRKPSKKRSKKRAGNRKRK